MSGEELRPQERSEDLIEWFRYRTEAIAAEQAERKRKYEHFISTIATLPPLDKAMEWLCYNAQHRQEDSDLEALVFLASRDRDIKTEIAKVIAEWKRAEKETLEQYNALIQHRSNSSSQITISNIASCEGDLSNFWSGLNLTIDATMLRTVEWCQIGGFEHWWERLAKVTTEDILANCWGGPQGAFLLFAMCRSDSARKLLATALRHLFEVIVRVDYQAPLPSSDSTEKRKTLADSVACLSAILFSEHQLQLASEKDGEAIKSILRGYDNGAWRTWPNDDSPSIETTAMAMHALAMKQPHGWEHLMAGASSWLLSVQNPEGYWHEAGAPDPVYLTVLVMDALNLAEGLSFPPTFATPPRSQTLARRLNTVDPARPDSAEGPCSGQDPVMTRKERVKAYMEEVKKLTGERITKAHIWREAGYKSRTEFERWERNAPRATNAADQNINRVLREKPHIKKYLKQHPK